MPKLSEVFSGSFLKAEDITKPTTVTISDAELKEFDDGNKLLLKFKGAEKALIVNRTNANVIAEVLDSDNTDDWIGKRITLEVRKVDFQGKRVPAIRVSDEPPQQVQRQAAPPPPADDADDDSDSIPFN